MKSFKASFTGAVLLALLLGFLNPPARAVEVTGQYTAAGRATPVHQTTKSHSRQHAAASKTGKGSFKLLSDRTMEAAGRTEKVRTFRANGSIYMLRTVKSKNGTSAEAFKQTAAGTKSKWRAIGLNKLPSTPEVKKMVAAATRKPASVVAKAPVAEKIPERTIAPPIASVSEPESAPVISTPAEEPKPVIGRMAKPEPASAAMIPPPEEKTEAEAEPVSVAAAAVDDVRPAKQPPSLTFVKPTTTPPPVEDKSAAKATVNDENSRAQKFLAEHPRFCPGNFFAGSTCR